tara:strand:- start:321 stop:2330 length:2010 start_codon:yes stop_codon:yes gene_type:complete
LAERKKYTLLLNLGFLGFTFFLSLFESSKGEDNFLEYRNANKYFGFSEDSLDNKSSNPTFGKLKEEKKENIFPKIKIFADKQFDYNQNIYKAEGNVKTIINGGILRSDSIIYEKLTGKLSAEGNIRFSKGGQYFRGKEFEFNLLKREGVIKDVYGILDIKNVVNDLKLDVNSNNNVTKNIIDHERSIYDDGIEFSFGNIKLPENKITRSDKSIHSINNWRFKSNLITIKNNVWKSHRVIFTNDPFDPHQISFEGIDVIAEEDGDGKLLVTSSKTNLILENRNKIFLGKRIFGEKKKKKNKFEFLYDGKDRDGLVLVRRGYNAIINDIELEFQPQFLINRAFISKTNNYKNSRDNDIDFADLFGLNVKLKANSNNWNFNSVNDLSTFNLSRFSTGLRHSSTLRKYFRMPILEESSFNIFTTYRSRAWNGTLGETEIKSAFGGFLENMQSFTKGEVKNNLNIRVGAARYEAEKLENSENIDLWRSSIFATLDSEYPIWKIDSNNNRKEKVSPLAPVAISPEFLFRTNISTAYFNYINSVDQGFLKLSLGPEIRLGTLERNFLDYSKFSVMPGVKIKFGNSPFKFDNAVDLKTLDISLIQQIYGPLMLDINAGLNIDDTSKSYGEFYGTKLGVLWHKRSYECGIYYHPNNEVGGLYFRINGFKFGNSVKALF